MKNTRQFVKLAELSRSRICLQISRFLRMPAWIPQRKLCLWPRATLWKYSNSRHCDNFEKMRLTRSMASSVKKDIIGSSGGSTASFLHDCGLDELLNGTTNVGSKPSTFLKLCPRLVKENLLGVCSGYPPRKCPQSKVHCPPGEGQSTQSPIHTRANAHQNHCPQWEHDPVPKEDTYQPSKRQCQQITGDGHQGKWANRMRAPRPWTDGRRIESPWIAIVAICPKDVQSRTRISCNAASERRPNLATK